MNSPIAITGLGFVSPLGTGADAVWNAWSQGESGIRRLEEDDARLGRGVDPVDLPAVGKAGFVRQFQPAEHITSPQLRRMDWCSRMLVASATQAVTDAGLSLTEESEQTRTALVIGSALGNQRETEKYLTRVLKRGPRAGQPFLFPNLVLNAAGGYAAIELSIRGPNLSVSDHEASGEIALVTAVDLLRAGLCDRAVVGGVDEFGTIYLGALRERRMLNQESLPTDTAARATNGPLIPGEGAAALVLEHERSAHERGRKPYATIAVARSGASSAGPYELPEPEAAATRLLTILDEGDSAPQPISAILGGSNGIGLRDQLDQVLCERIGTRQDEAPSLVSVNELVGYWGARGAFNAGLAALAAHHGRIPNTRLENPRRILIPGSGRSGVVVALALDANPAA